MYWVLVILMLNGDMTTIGPFTSEENCAVGMYRVIVQNRYDQPEKDYDINLDNIDSMVCEERESQ